jgi:hypothetical protein
MGAYTCEFGTIHKRCRCPIPHTISCPTPKECADREDYVGKHRACVDENLCSDQFPCEKHFSHTHQSFTAKAEPVTNPTIDPAFKDLGYVTDDACGPCGAPNCPICG